uniref:Uncharacterized protein n=1 Tax=Nelumbo nucifera TaxID=4432 RepID=A0A823A1W7_NELNU|nr:TPA_asm: hypothetical protein HUJ06_018913 [Nelumbo nucifera]
MLNLSIHYWCGARQKNIVLQFSIASIQVKKDKTNFFQTLLQMVTYLHFQSTWQMAHTLILGLSKPANSSVKNCSTIKIHSDYQATSNQEIMYD